MLSDCHPHEAQLPAAEWALQTAHVGFLSHVKGSTHVLSCFHLGASELAGLGREDPAAYGWPPSFQLHHQYQPSRT